MAKMKNLLFLISFLLVGCILEEPNHFVANFQVIDKGVVVNTPFYGLSAGDHYVLAGNGAKEGVVRFHDVEVWESIKVGRYYRVEFYRDGWVCSIMRSPLDSNFVISSDWGRQ